MGCAPEHSRIRDCRAVRRKRLPGIFAAYLGRWHGILARSHPDVSAVCRVARTEPGRVESWNSGGVFLRDDARPLPLADPETVFGGLVLPPFGLLRERSFRRFPHRPLFNRSICSARVCLVQRGSREGALALKEAGSSFWCWESSHY